MRGWRLVVVLVVVVAGVGWWWPDAEPPRVMALVATDAGPAVIASSAGEYRIGQLFRGQEPRLATLPDGLKLASGRDVLAVTEGAFWVLTHGPASYEVLSYERQGLALRARVVLPTGPGGRARGQIDADAAGAVGFVESTEGRRVVFAVDAGGELLWAKESLALGRSGGGAVWATPDGTVVAATRRSLTIRDRRTGAVLQDMAAATPCLVGDAIWTAAGDGLARWDADGQVMRRVPAMAEARELAFSEWCGHRHGEAVATGYGGTLRVSPGSGLRWRTRARPAAGVGGDGLSPLGPTGSTGLPRWLPVAGKGLEVEGLLDLDSGEVVPLPIGMPRVLFGSVGVGDALVVSSGRAVHVVDGSGLASFPVVRPWELSRRHVWGSRLMTAREEGLGWCELDVSAETMSCHEASTGVGARWSPTGRSRGGTQGVQTREMKFEVYGCSGCRRVSSG